MRTFSPLLVVGFRSNPFRTLTEEELAEIAILPDELEHTIDDERCHVQIIGDCGHGKTTALIAIAARLQSQDKRIAYERVALGQKAFRTSLRSLDAFLLDEADKLGWCWRWFLFAKAVRCGVRLFIGTHKDFAKWFRHFKLPFMTVHLAPISVERLRAILQRRLDFFSLSGVSPVTFSDDAVTYLQERFGGDLAAMERYLYEFFQNLPQSKVIDASALRGWDDKFVGSFRREG